jgi:hypothetical protein
MVSQPNGALIGVGVGMLTIGWVSSAVAAAVGMREEEEETRDELDDVEAEDWAPLFAPVAGPVVAIVTLSPDPPAIGLLVADTLLQTAGVVGIIAGALDTRHKLVRTQTAAPRLDIVPLAGGLACMGRF